MKNRIANLVCLALVASALVLTYEIWSHIMGQSGWGLLLRAFGAGEEETAVYSGYEELSYAVSAITPLRCAVRPGEGEGLYGTQDRETASACFERFGALLAEALETAEKPESASREDWEKALSGTMLFLDLGGRVPVATLAQLLGAEVDETLSAEGRMIVLALRDGEAVLYTAGGSGEILHARTQADADYLATLAAEYAGNGFRFAHEAGAAAGEDTLLLTPETSVAELEAYNALETASEADSDRIVSGILENLGFNAYMSGAYSESDGTRVYVEEERTLRVSPDGRILYEDSGDAAEGTQTLSQEEKTACIADASRMASRLLSAYLGDARLFLLEAGTDSDGLFRVSFGAECGGIRILTQRGAMAEFFFDGTQLRRASAQLHGYRRTGGSTEIIPALQALAAAQSTKGFGLYYLAADSGIRAGWYTEE